jgi:hypothetical protein
MGIIATKNDGVTQKQWSTPSNYSFLDSRYDLKYAPVPVSGGYLNKNSFDEILSMSAPYTSLKIGQNNLSTKYDDIQNMQNIYNTSFSTIANNLGLTANGGVVSGTIKSDIFVTRAILQETIDKYNLSAGPQMFDENTINASKSGKLIRIFGTILFRSGITIRLMKFSNFSIMNQFSIKSIDSVVIQPMDMCDVVNGGAISSDGPNYICKQPVYSVKNISATGFSVVRPASLSFAGNGAFWRYVQFDATGFCV